MTIEFDPAARRGEQYTVHLDNGETYRGISRYACEGALLRHGLSLSGIKATLAEARLQQAANVL